MKSFNYFLNEELLVEALNSPVEFIMTDDTKMPKEIYATFNINGNDYGCSLVLSKYERVYNLDFYRVVSIKKRFWSFLGTKDILPALSTIIKFMEACYPFLQSHMDGILIDVPGKIGSEKYARLLKAVIKKSYVKKYKVVDVQKKTDKANNYLFLIKVGSDPKKLYKTAAFHKNFEFDPDPNGPVTSEVLDTVAGDYYKKLKSTISMKPSQKYAFGAVPVEIQASDDLVTQLDTAKLSHLEKIANPNAVASNTPKKAPSAHIVSNEDIANEIASGYSDHSSFVYNATNEHATVALPYLLAALMTSAYSKIIQFGYDDSKIVLGDLQYVLNHDVSNAIKKMPKPVRKALEDDGFINSAGSVITSDDNIAKVKTAMKLFPFLNKLEISSMQQNIMANVPDVALDMGSTSTSNQKVKKMELPFALESTVAGYDKANNTTPYDGYMGFQEDPEQTNTRVEAIRKMPSVKAWYDKGFSGAGFNSLHSYTGSHYDEMNANMRGMIKSDGVFNPTLSNQKSIRLLKYFDKEAPELDEGVWVYRNTYIPSGVDKFQVGDDFVDAAFLSTSVRPSCSIGWMGNLRWKIYLPKGTRCFPIFNSSAHPGENEIVLPAFSMIRITEIHMGVKAPHHACMVGIYIGNANKGAMDLLKANKVDMTEESKIESYMYESVKKMNDKQTQKDPKVTFDNPADKWSQPTLSYEQMMGINKMVKNGTLKKSSK